MNPTYMIAGGGTGGHIFPALAIGERLLQEQPDARLLFVGTNYGMEKDLIPARGHRLLTLPMRGLLGKSRLRQLAVPFRLLVSLLRAFWWVLRFRPKVVIGVGGYASVPMMWAAAWCRVPTLLQEQNAVPGLANRISSRWAKLACLGFAEAADHLRCPSVVTGNPVRKGFASGAVWSTGRNLILVLGGSQGARALNQILPEILGQVLSGDDGLAVIHQCGRKHVEAVKSHYDATDLDVEVVGFIEDMQAVLKRALVVICRAGASTVSELKQVGVPAVLIPFPQATHDHQTKNAASLVSAGAGLMIREGELSDSGEILAELLKDRQRLAIMAASYAPDPPDAAAWCGTIVRALAQRVPVSRILEEPYVSKN